MGKREEQSKRLRGDEHGVRHNRTDSIPADPSERFPPGDFRVARLGKSETSCMALGGVLGVLKDSRGFKRR